MAAVAKHYKVSEIKQKLMRPAQTSVYAVSITTNESVNSFASQRGVSRTKHHEMINLACCEASLPGSSLATHEVNNDYHGSTEKMVYRRIYDDTIDLTFYVDYEYAVIKYFQSWMNYIVGEGEYFTSKDYLTPSTFYRMKYPKYYKHDIHLVKFEKDESRTSSRPKIEYTFVQAFPINMVSVPVSYEASDLLKLTVSFAYTRYVMFGSDSFYSDPTNSAIGGGGGGGFGSASTPDTQAVYNATSFDGITPGSAGSLPDYSGVYDTSDETRVFQQYDMQQASASAWSPSNSNLSSTSNSSGSNLTNEYQKSIDQELEVQATGKPPEGGFTMF